MAEFGSESSVGGPWVPPASIDEARALARQRFKSRLQSGERIGECGCSDDDAVAGGADGSPPECVVGVRFRDSGRVYYYRPAGMELRVGDWVIVATARGQEAARIVIGQHHVRQSLLQGTPGSVIRLLDDDDARRLEDSRRNGAAAIRTFGERLRERRLGIKPIAADYSFDGAHVTLSYSVPDRERAPEPAALQDLARRLASELACRVELRQVGPRDEARLLGGLGRCGRTLCCSSWLPVFPDISMTMAKTQDLPLNPAKVSGVCGRLLCCLSYENEQYRQMKAVMPKLGQAIETPAGGGQVVSMHLLKELVTVRLEENGSEVTFRSEELGLGSRGAAAGPATTPPAVEPDTSPPGDETDAIAGGSGAPEPPTPGRRRRRRRPGRRGA
jgi:cell fate regulator YaaT (PSP1 superfamily)